MFVLSIFLLAIALLLAHYIGFSPMKLFVDRRIKEAVEAAVENRNGLPLLKLIVDGTIRWDSFGYSTDGYLYVEDDMYFYLKIKGYSSDNLVGHEMSSMLECAAINAAKQGRAVDNYTAYLASVELSDEMRRELDSMTFITVSDDDPLRDAIVSYVRSRGSGVGVDYGNSIPHFSKWRMR